MTWQYWKQPSSVTGTLSSFSKNVPSRNTPSADPCSPQYCVPGAGGTPVGCGRPPRWWWCRPGPVTVRVTRTEVGSGVDLMGPVMVAERVVLMIRDSLLVGMGTKV